MGTTCTSLEFHVTCCNWLASASSQNTKLHESPMRSLYLVLQRSVLPKTAAVLSANPRMTCTTSIARVDAPSMIHIGACKGFANSKKLPILSALRREKLCAEWHLVFSVDFVPSESILFGGLGVPLGSCFQVFLMRVVLFFLFYCARILFLRWVVVWVNMLQGRTEGTLSYVYVGPRYPVQP